MKTLRCVAAIVLVCLAGTAQADLITNGSFDKNLSGWQEVSANCIWYDSTGDGGQGGVALLQASSYLYQYDTAHPFAAGETYTVSFQASGIGYAGQLTARLFDYTDTPATALATLFVTPAELGTGNPVDFKTYTYQYVVDPARVGHNWVVCFDAAGTNIYTGIDNVSVTATPEPTTFSLLSLGLIGLLAYAWRKRK